MENVAQQYDSVGNNVAPQPNYQSPSSNPGVVYQPANQPTNPGGFKIGTQTVSTLIFRAASSDNQIRISLTPLQNPDQTAGTIYIIDQDKNIVFAAGISSTDFIAATTIQDFVGEVGLFVNRDASAGVTSQDVAIFKDTDTSSTGTTVLVDNHGTGVTLKVEQLNGACDQPTAELINTSPTATHFINQLLMNNLAGTGTSCLVLTSDRTSPNGVLSAPKGSLCLNSSATGQIAYNTNGSTGWTLL